MTLSGGFDYELIDRTSTTKYCFFIASNKKMNEVTLKIFHQLSHNTSQGRYTATERHLL